MTKLTNEQIEEVIEEYDSSHCEDMRDALRELLILRQVVEVYEAGWKDAKFILEGSTADEGQSDEMLEKRELAFLEFFCIPDKVAAIRKEG